MTDPLLIDIDGGGSGPRGRALRCGGSTLLRTCVRHNEEHGAWGKPERAGPGPARDARPETGPGTPESAQDCGAPAASDPDRLPDRQDPAAPGPAPCPHRFAEQSSRSPP